MITVTKTDSAVQFTFSGSQHYLYDGTMEVPFNSLILVEDESDMLTFRKASTNDILFSAMYTEFSSLGETKDEVVGALEGMMFAEGGGTGSGVTPSEVQTMIDEAVSGKADSSAVTQSLSSKQDTLVSGTNIKTINNESLLGSGNITISGGGGAYYIDIATLGSGITDEDWDGVVAAIDAHRPIYAGYPRQDGGIYYYGVECMNKNVSNTEIVLTASDDNRHYFYTFTKNGSNDYSYTVATKPYVPTISTAVTSGSTDAEIPTAKATYDAIQAGGGSSITVDPTLDTGSTNPVANSAITNAVNGKLNSVDFDATNWVGTGTTGLRKTVNGSTYTVYAFVASINQKPILSSSYEYVNKFSLVETSAITTSMTSSSTDAQVPSAKAVYDQLGGLKFVSLTQAEYNALATKDSTTIYFIKDNSN